MKAWLKSDSDRDRSILQVFHDVTISEFHYDVRAESGFGGHQYEELVMLLSEPTEERLDLLALVSSMPSLRHILQFRFRQTIVSIMTQEASNCHAVAKLNSRFEVERGPVD